MDPGKGMSTRYHPMHLHGGHFQVILINGMVPEREMWKDTLEIPPNQYIDIAVKFYYPSDPKRIQTCYVQYGRIPLFFILFYL
jgi:FtsP/CotA-like multicopper oxidase with cupredoxin domain